MLKKIGIVFAVFFLSGNAFAIDWFPGTPMKDGTSRLSLGGTILWGTLSPQANFTTNPALNRARMYEQNLRFTRAVGDGMLKNRYVEIESKTFQSRQETVRGIVAHPSDNGWAITARTGGNFYHQSNFSFGGWFQTGTPVIMDRNKFVDPVIDYAGGGLNTDIKFSSALGMTNSAYVGSGIFLPWRRNPHVEGTTLLSLNFGVMTGGKDFIVKAGGLIDYDLTSRIDAAYQASTLGDGRIKNTIFATPFVLDMPFGETWRLDGSYIITWKGKSLRGSQFATFNLSKIF